MKHTQQLTEYEKTERERRIYYGNCCLVSFFQIDFFEGGGAFEAIERNRTAASWGVFFLGLIKRVGRLLMKRYRLGIHGKYKNFKKSHKIFLWSYAFLLFITSNAVLHKKILLYPFPTERNRILQVKGDYIRNFAML